MTWSRFDDAAPKNPKATIAGNDAWALWCAAVMYCNRHLTDGHVSLAALAHDCLPSPISISKAKKLAKALCDARIHPDQPGLFEHGPLGYVVHDFLDWNPSKADVESKRRADRARKRRGTGIQTDSARNPDGIQTDGATESRRNPDGRRNGIRSDSATPAGAGAGARTRAPSPPSPAQPREGDPSLVDVQAVTRAEESPPPRQRPEHIRNFEASFLPEAIPLPDDWMPNAGALTLAKKRGLELDEVAAKFRAHRKSTGKVAVDWHAEFDYWLRQERIPGRGGDKPPGLARHEQLQSEDRRLLMNRLLDDAKAGRFGHRAQERAESGERSKEFLDLLERADERRRNGDTANA